MLNSLTNRIYDCAILSLGKIQNRAGNLTVAESYIKFPFSIRRIYYLYDIPSGEERGGHAHKELSQMIIAASGSFKVLMDDGNTKKVVSLNRPDYGLLIVPGIWRELFDFSSGAICLVLASQVYDENDYIRDYGSFEKYKGLKCDVHS